MKSHKSNTGNPIARHIMLAAILLFCGAVVAFCLFYLLHDHQYLHNWYLSLNGCLYRRSQWGKEFFSPRTKAAGNVLAVAGGGAAIGLLAIVYRWRVKHTTWAPQTNAATLRWYIAVGIAAVTAGVYSQHLACPAYDEVFSAVNCAELHPFQALSYYMLPNNHIYFNTINNICFGWLHHPVESGRWISTVAYCGAMLAAFHCFRQWTRDNIVAFAAIVPIALQLTTWGFAGQARGYEVQLCAGWITLAAANTFRRNGSTTVLKTIAICSIAGFAMASSYLMFYVAAVILLAGWGGKKNMLLVARYQLITLLAVFMLYLPALCFSGVAAFTANRYVAPTTASLTEFLPAFADVTSSFIHYCFSNIGGENGKLSYILFALPLLLLLRRNRKDRAIGWLHVLTWLAYAAITLQMRHAPFGRNLIVQFSITMACVVYTLYVVLHRAGEIWRIRKIVFHIMFAVPCLVLAALLFRQNVNDIPYTLYYNQVNDIYRGHQQELGWIDKNASIGCSDECFLSYYIFRKQNPHTNKCATGTEDYYIKRADEPLPPDWEQHYEKWKNGSEDYEFYRRRKLADTAPPH